MSSSWFEGGVPNAVFLDRDGTIIVEQNYLKDPDLVALETGAADGLRRFAAAGAALVVVTNQSGIARGFLSEADYARVNARMVELLAAEGVRLEGVYHCPHSPDGDCRCRKPRPGMIEQAAAAHGLRPAAGVVIGDKASDMGLAKAVGARALLVTTGYGERTRSEAQVAVDGVVANLAAAADLLGL